MSFQAYLDTIEERTGLTPRQVLDLAREKGFDTPTTKAGDVVAWFKEDFDLGRGHAMALWYVLKNGPVAPGKHVRSGGTHSDPSETLWLDGKATMPAVPATQAQRTRSAATSSRTAGATSRPSTS